MGTKSLKARNVLVLRTFIGLHVIVLFFVVLDEGTALLSGASFVRELGAAFVPAAILTPLIAVLNGILPTRTKECLVFCRLRHPLPGSRFRELINGDPRIDIAALERSHGQLPESPDDQNAFWYRLSKKHENRPSVADAHGHYLLTRDMAGFAALSVIPLPIVAGIFGQSVTATIYYTAALVVQLAVLIFVARNYGHRFVTNVLAEESALAEKSSVQLLT